MIRICAIIQVKNFIALDEFERAAHSIMQEHEGKIIAAFESKRNNDNSGEEIHLLEFSSIEKFNDYKTDARLLTLSSLRESAMTSIEIKIATKNKFY